MTLDFVNEILILTSRDTFGGLTAARTVGKLSLCEEVIWENVPNHHIPFHMFKHLRVYIMLF